MDALRVAMRTQADDLAKYPPSQGHVGMRELIAQRLEENRGLKTGIDSIFLSSGAGGAIQVILDAFIDPGDIVLVEEFCYLGTLAMLLSRRANVIHVPTDEQGMDTDAVRSILSDLAWQGKRPKMIYTISVYQNPMGMTMSLERRKALLELSHSYGVPHRGERVLRRLRDRRGASAAGHHGNGRRGLGDVRVGVHQAAGLRPAPGIRRGARRP